MEIPKASTIAAKSCWCRLLGEAKVRGAAQPGGQSPGGSSNDCPVALDMSHKSKRGKKKKIMKISVLYIPLQNVEEGKYKSPSP